MYGGSPGGAPVQCINCGAVLPPPLPGERYVRCAGCGHPSQVAGPPAGVNPFAAPPPGAGFGGGPPMGPVYYGAPVRNRGGGGVAAAGIGIGIVVAVLMLFVGGGVMFALIARRAAPVPAGGPVVLATAENGDPLKGDPGQGGVVPPGEHLQWVGFAPAPVRINGDAVEDFVGRYRVLDLSTGGSHEFVGGFDGASLKRLWLVALGSTQEAFGQGTFVVVSGNRMLVTDFRDGGHVYDVTNGKETSSFQMSDRAARVCGSPAGSKPEAFVDVQDRTTVLVDLATGAVKKGAARPAYCPVSSASGCSFGFHRTQARCESVDTAAAGVKVTGFEGDHVLTDEASHLSVIVGTKSPGTRIPIAVGIDPGGKTAKWQRTIPSLDPQTVHEGVPVSDLGAGKFVAELQLASGGARISAIDARSGAALWEVPLPRSKDGSLSDELTISDARVYVPHWTWLDVFDAKTGKLVGTVGIW